MYTDIFLFIIAFSVFSLYMPQQVPMLTPGQTLLCSVLVMAALYLYSRCLFRRCASGTTSHTHAMTIAKTGALFFFAALILIFDIKQALPAQFFKSEFIVNLYGISVFMLLLLVVWLSSFRSYSSCCDPDMSLRAYILWHVRMSLTLVLPWLLFSALQDCLLLMPGWLYERITGSVPVFVLLIVFLIAGAGIFFPWVIVRLWGCSALPPGPVRTSIEQVCRRTGVRCSEIYLWNIFGGHMLSAGVLGFVAAFRYLLISPALLELLDTDELEAVIAHEAAHVRHRHMLFYLVFIFGYGFLCFAFYGVFFSTLLAHDVYLDLALRSDGTFGFFYHVSTMLVVAGFLLVYFRLLFGFFSRAFERQADCAALALTGSVRGIAGALEKIAAEGFAGREAPSWHHYSIAERCRFMHACARSPDRAVRHGRRVRAIVWGYCVLMCALAVLTWDLRHVVNDLEKRNTLVFVEKISQRRPQDAVLHFQLAGLYYEKKLFMKAEKEYRRVLELRPEFYDACNNLAWLYATCEDHNQRNYPEALRLARIAVSFSPQPYILDTLAECLYVNELYRQALIAAEEALSSAGPENREYYEQRFEQFRTAFRAQKRAARPYDGNSIAL